MDKIKGISASRGIAKGKVHIEQLKELDEIEEKKISESEVDKEVESLGKAIDRAKEELKEIKEKTKDEVGDEEAEIFKAHLMFFR